MKLLFFIACSALVLSMGCKTQYGIQTTPEGQVEEIMATWPGTYHNDRQITEVTSRGGDVWRIDDSGEGGYLNITSHYIKLERPDIGDNVLYVEEYRDGTPSETYRQRIYTIDVDPELSIVKVKMWPFKDKEKYIGAWQTPAVLASLSKDEISAYPDFCDLHVKQVDDKYYMYMNEQDCTFGEKTFNYEVMLGKDMFSYRDKISQKSDGKILTSAADFAYHHLDRVSL